MALSPGQLPQFGPERRRGVCDYDLKVSYRIELYPVACVHYKDTHPPQLQSLPASNGNSILKSIELEKVTSPDKAEVDFHCERLVDEATGLIGIHLEWSYSDESSYIREAIAEYMVGLRSKTVLPSGTVDETPGCTLTLNSTLSQQVSGTQI